MCFLSFKLYLRLLKNTRRISLQTTSSRSGFTVNSLTNPMHQPTIQTNLTEPILGHMSGRNRINFQIIQQLTNRTFDALKTNETMQKHELDRFKQRLLDKKKGLLQSIKKTMESNRQTEARLSFELVKDNPDRSVDELLKHVDSHVLGSKADELEMIDSALVRIREGTYGECEMCGEDIPRNRLEVYPEGDFCITCQEQSERMNSLAKDQNIRPEPPGIEAYLEDEE